LGAVNRYLAKKIKSRDVVSYNKSAFFKQALDAASLSLLPQLSLSTGLVGSFTLE